MAAQLSVRALLRADVRRLHLWHWLAPARHLDAIAGWGWRPTTRWPRAYAARRSLPYLALEDGFLRSYAPGRRAPSLSLVVDRAGIYYAADSGSSLETLLNSDADLLRGIEEACTQARDLICRAQLGKYNAAPSLQAGALGAADRGRVLVVDQTLDDAAIVHGGADAATFERMLASALDENPGATVYVKTHPEVSGGAKRGYYSSLPRMARVVPITEPVSPMSLVPHMDRVYVATSHLGFEALLAGKPVTCFGTPWYAGWGVTDDRQPCAHRTRRRSVQELFAAAYFHYSRYLDPATHGEGNIFDAIDWLARQKLMAEHMQGRSIAVGFRRWKARNVRGFLGLDARRVHFVRNARAAARLAPGPQDRLVVWGSDPAEQVLRLARQAGARLLRMEDGFLRSVGLGSDFVPPLSLVLDGSGMYFDPRQPSDLENLLNQRVFSPADLSRARAIRQSIVELGLTKYNIEQRRTPAWQAGGKRIILVPGQVEDDASIRYGCGEVRSNLGLLQAARAEYPDAYIVYKPHPDVRARNRAGRMHLRRAMQYADTVETSCSVVSCIEACDEVHTMTSLTGFDALLRGKRVVVHGRPFYAGWGLTADKLPMARRDRTLSLDELVAGTLLHYPVYWDPVLKGYTTCEATINQLARRRNAIIAGRGEQALSMSASYRLWRKIWLWLQCGFTVKF
ncbi:capsular polysaccharide biosynthesis protein [Bordetella petrii]|uniref:capsular polysaccharide biosynthesis protein n=1 Tax=Bordetella petrii TaxID=94624 RepID=UPI001F6003C8|nr:capsular polysaccharide biosynthesis protein [Bordetella petrii]